MHGVFYASPSCVTLEAFVYGRNPTGHGRFQRKYGEKLALDTECARTSRSVPNTSVRLCFIMLSVTCRVLRFRPCCVSLGCRCRRFYTTIMQCRPELSHARNTAPSTLKTPLGF